jgi:hypothetical protein
VVDASPDPVQVVLNRVKTAIGAVKKEDRNKHQGFNFRGIDAVVNASASVLNEHGIITVPQVIDVKYEPVVIGQNKTPMGHAILKVAYRFYGPAGDYIEAMVASEAMDSGDKAMAKAMSVAYRIALLQVLNLPTDEPDPDSDSYERATPETQISRSAKSGGVADWADLGKNANLQIPANMADFANTVNDVDEVRKLYKRALSEGTLQAEIAHPATGEKITLEKYLLERADELKFRDSTKSAE